MNGPIGIGAEFRLGSLMVRSLNGSCHPLAHRPAKNLDPFAALGFTTSGDLNFDARGLGVGGEVTYWPHKRVGLRLDGFSFLPRRHDIPFENWNLGPASRSTFHFGCDGGGRRLLVPGFLDTGVTSKRSVKWPATSSHTWLRRAGAAAQLWR